MNINNITKVVDSISTLANWSKTTFIRTFYKLKPHLIQRKVEKLFQYQNVDAIYVTSETDNPTMNHLHLAIAGRKLTRSQIAKSMGVKTEHVGNIETLEAKSKHYNTSVNNKFVRTDTLTRITIFFINPKH